MKFVAISGVAAAVVSAMALFGSPASNAAPAPSSVVTVVCYRGVNINPGEGPGVTVQLFAANGAVVGGDFIECPSGGAGTRIRMKIATPDGAAASASFRCWNGFIATNTVTGPLALTGECLDTVPNPDVAFAKVTIR